MAASINVIFPNGRPASLRFRLQEPRRKRPQVEGEKKFT